MVLQEDRFRELYRATLALPDNKDKLGKIIKEHTADLRDDVDNLKLQIIT